MPNSKHRKKAKRRQKAFELAKNSRPKAIPETTHRDIHPPTHRPDPLMNHEFVCQTPIYISESPDGVCKLESADNEHHPEIKHLDGFEFTPQYGHDLSDAMYLEIAKAHIPLDTLDECSELGHPRQAWAILSHQQPMSETEVCGVCGKKPDFPSSGGSLSVRGFIDDSIDEDLDDDRFIEHAVIESIEGGNLFFRFVSRSIGS